MRWIVWTMGVLFLGAIAAGAVGAGEEARKEQSRPGPDLRAAKLDVMREGLGALRIRLDAQLQVAELLRERGRVDEALAAFRQVDEIWSQGMEKLEALLRGTEDRPLPPPVTRISAGKTAAAGTSFRSDLGAGGAFRRRGGGAGGPPTPETKGARIAVEDALKWLAAHQSPHGGWESAGFHKWRDGKPAKQGPDGAGKALHDPGVTGLALSAFFGAGYTHRGKHPFAKTVARGLRYLKNIQDAEGCFGPRNHAMFIYNHGAAALAMIEAYGMTQSPIFRGSAQKALDFIAQARNPYLAWRYGVRPGDNDTSVTVWMVACLHSAKLVNDHAKKHGLPVPFRIDEQAFAGARAWVDKMTDPDSGRTGFTSRGGAPARAVETVDKFPAEKSESMTAAGILIRIWTGEAPTKSDLIGKGAKLLTQLPPRWDEDDGSIDLVYWYFGSLAMFQIGGSGWKTWNEALRDQIRPHQRKDTTYGLYRGSWDPVGAWGTFGGRVYSTALMAMALQTHYRYERVFDSK